MKKPFDKFNKLCEDTTMHKQNRIMNDREFKPMHVSLLDILSKQSKSKGKDQVADNNVTPYPVHEDTLIQGLSDLYLKTHQLASQLSGTMANPLVSSNEEYTDAIEKSVTDMTRIKKLLKNVAKTLGKLD